jgi:hypothetical protein
MEVKNIPCTSVYGIIKLVATLKVTDITVYYTLVTVHISVPPEYGNVMLQKKKM